MKHFKLIACKLLQRELSAVAVGSEHYTDITFIRQELHSTPEMLRQALQAEIDAVESGQDLHSAVYDPKHPQAKELDAILLGYGLCSNAVVGLHSRSVPLVIPRAHDCTALLMGSKEAYRSYFNAVKGTSFLSRGWMDHGFDLEQRDMEQLRQMYMEQYEDEDAVEYLLDIARQSMANYRAITCIFWPEIPDGGLEEAGRGLAAENGWEYRRYDGNSSLLREMLSGEWDEEKFLVVQPGQVVQPSYGEDILCAR